MIALMAGFGLGLSLIMAIGAQNAFVLRKGLRREHVLPICLVCSISDMALIILGVVGFSTAAAHIEWLAKPMAFFGGVFLLCYGAKSLWSAFRGKEQLDPSTNGQASLAASLSTCLALTWLNPHVYLDTMVLIGSVSTQYRDHTIAFAAGASAASFVFFFAIGFGARLLRPVFASSTAWRVFETVIGLTMWAIAARLFLVM